MTLSQVQDRLNLHQAELRAFGVLQLYVSGSVARGDASAESDIDFVVELERYTLRDFVGLKLALEDWLGVSVDLTTFESLKPQVRRSLEENLRRVA